MIAPSSLRVISARKVIHPTVGITIPVFKLAGNLPKPLDWPHHMLGRVNEAQYQVGVVANARTQRLHIDVEMVSPISYSLSFALNLSHGTWILALAEAGQFGIEFASDPKHLFFTFNLSNETTNCMQDAWVKTFFEQRSPRSRQGAQR